jgi:hypothetical protein
VSGRKALRARALKVAPTWHSTNVASLAPASYAKKRFLSAWRRIVEMIPKQEVVKISISAKGGQSFETP